MDVNLGDYYLDTAKISSSNSFHIYELFRSMIQYYGDANQKGTDKDKFKIIFNSLIISGFLKNVRDQKIDDIVL